MANLLKSECAGDSVKAVQADNSFESGVLSPAFETDSVKAFVVSARKGTSFVTPTTLLPAKSLLQPQTSVTRAPSMSAEPKAKKKSARKNTADVKVSAKKTTDTKSSAKKMANAKCGVKKTKNLGVEYSPASGRRASMMRVGAPGK